MTGSLLNAARPAETAPVRHPEVHLLANLARECALSGIGRRVLLLRMSRLPSALRRPQHVRLALAALQPLTLADRARVFTLRGDDLAVAWRGEAANALAATTTVLSRLFEDEEASSSASPWALFHLPEQSDALLAALGPSEPPPQPTRRTPPRSLDAASLAALEAGLAHVDVAGFARRRRFCAADEDGLFRLQWEQRYLSVTDIADTLVPDRAVRADPWLFRRLTRTLDQRMLSLLAAPQELSEARPFSLRLNIASVLSPGFLRFDAALPLPLRGQVVLEVQPPDVMGDPAAFVFARDFVRERGYRLLLRELDADLLAAFPPDRIGVDLVQMRWSAALEPVGRAALPDPARCVLTRADTQAALYWGRANGVAFYQGKLAEPV